MGTALLRIIEALVLAPISDGDILFSKLDIKDGYWRMAVNMADSWNFAYVLPNHPSEPVEIVIPTALQMG